MSSRALRALLVGRPLSKAELSEVVGVTPNALTPFIEASTAAGVLAGRQRGESETSGPRPSGRLPTVYSLDLAGRGFLLGYDFSEDYVRVQLRDLAGLEHPSAPSLDGDKERFFSNVPVAEDATAAMLAARELTDRILTAAQLTRNDILGLGVGVAAPVGRDANRDDERDDAVVRDRQLMRGWRTVRIASKLRQHLGWDDMPIYVDNDAALGALAEQWQGKAKATTAAAPQDARREKVTVFVKWTIGVGVGLIVGSKPLRGTENLSGEMGHNAVRVRKDEVELLATSDEELMKGSGLTCRRRCTYPCVEAYGGTDAVLAYAASAEAWDDPTVSSANKSAHVKQRLELLGSDSRQSKQTQLEAVLQSAAQDPLRSAAGRAVTRASHYIGQGLAGVVNVLNPHQIIIGGAMVRHGIELFPAYDSGITEAVAGYAMPENALDYRLDVGEINTGATVRGAIARVREEVLVEYLVRLLER